MKLYTFGRVSLVAGAVILTLSGPGAQAASHAEAPFY